MISAHWCRNKEQEQKLAQWVTEHILDADTGFVNSRGLALVESGEVVGGVIFHNWNPQAGTIEISAAATSKRWMTRPIINQIMRYTFSVAQCVYTRTDERHPALHRIYSALGWNRYEIPRLRGENVAEVVHTLTREQWAESRFNLEKKRGK